MLCLLQQANKYINYTAIQQSRERWDSHFKTEVCFNYTYIFSKGRIKTESRRLDRRDWPCFSDPLLYEEERRNNNNSKKLLKKLKPPPTITPTTTQRKCVKVKVKHISIHQFFDFLTSSKASALYTAIYIVFIQLYLYSVLSSLLSRSRSSYRRTRCHWLTVKSKRSK